MIMAIQAIGDPAKRGHLIGDVPALLLVTLAFAVLLPRARAGVKALAWVA